jgi:hypothetical protein
MTILPPPLGGQAPGPYAPRHDASRYYASRYTYTTLNSVANALTT